MRLKKSIAVYTAEFNLDNIELIDKYVIEKIKAFIGSYNKEFSTEDKSIFYGKKALAKLIECCNSGHIGLEPDIRDETGVGDKINWGFICMSRKRKLLLNWLRDTNNIPSYNKQYIKLLHLLEESSTFWTTIANVIMKRRNSGYSKLDSYYIDYFCKAMNMDDEINIIMHLYGDQQNYDMLMNGEKAGENESNTDRLYWGQNQFSYFKDFRFDKGKDYYPGGIL